MYETLKFQQCLNTNIMSHLRLLNKIIFIFRKDLQGVSFAFDLPVMSEEGRGVNGLTTREERNDQHECLAVKQLKKVEEEWKQLSCDNLTYTAILELENGCSRNRRSSISFSPLSRWV